MYETIFPFKKYLARAAPLEFCGNDPDREVALPVQFVSEPITLPPIDHNRKISCVAV